MKYPNSNYQHNIRLSCRLITHTPFDYDYIGFNSAQLTHFCQFTFVQRPPRSYSGLICVLLMKKSSSFMQKAKCDGNMIDFSSTLSDLVTKSN